MRDCIKVDICIIGAGSGGLSVAAGAAQMGAKVALVEKGQMGGDCLNTGCVPSKALLAAAEKAQSMRDARAFGIGVAEPLVDWEKVRSHVQAVIEKIAPNDSQERFESLGVTVVRAAGRFVDNQTLQAGDVCICAKYFVLATGSSPFVPPIPGLDGIPYFTNENIFLNASPVGHLIVIGGGPIGLEMAQAHRRLGAKVTVIEVARFFPRDDAELAVIVLKRLADEGIGLYEGVTDLRLESRNKTVRAVFNSGGADHVVEGSHLLLATGRRANVANLNLEAAGVKYSSRGIEVDARLRTTNRCIYAIGDVAGPYQFTHMAAYQAGVAIRNMLFRIPAKVNYAAVPWVTYTDPEFAHVGMLESEARGQGLKVKVLHWEFAENDRAQAEIRTEGKIKVVTDPKGRILGATIVGLHAGELIQSWVLAISQKLKIGAMASMIAPYPTLAEVNKRVAGTFYTPFLYSNRVRKIVRFLLRYC